MPSRWPHAVKVVAIVVSCLSILGVVGLGLLTGFFYMYGSKAIFHPDSHYIEEDPAYIRGPAVAGLPFDDVYITTRDNVKLHGWLIKQPEPKEAPTFVCFQGNYGYQGFRLAHAEELYGLGANVFLMDYRGFGRSEGTPTVEGVYADADAALDYILSNQDVNNEDIFVLGHSLGGGVAVDLASRRGNQIKGLVIENTFTSLREVAESCYPALKPLIRLFTMVQKDGMENIEKIRNVKVPTFFVGGTNDKDVPPEHTEQLFQECGAPKKWLKMVEGGTHLHCYGWAVEGWQEDMIDFIRTAREYSGEEPAARGTYKPSDKHLDAEDGKSVDSTLTERDEGDNKADGPLSSRVSRAAAILVLCIIAAATTAIIRHGKAKSPATRGPWREQQDESTLQQLDEPSHDDKYLNATRDWTLFDDESVASSHLYSASTFDESSSTAQTNVSKQGAV
ncbi:hypothetical protein, conserved [Eimeria acervulina]|uniref:Serine aminopeptidase S33 domain-containing protein n=1 Tax=Eimeria acervulina TaxID=5801 RepID=U6GJ59_EIMAC|nr:hypothetical protein, conserved [Eimeria acervulina]CDI79338.1 hypothetical protein, conserved [Eimeria acervulina]